MAHAPLTRSPDSASIMLKHADGHPLGWVRWLLFAACLWAALGTRYAQAVEVQAIPDIDLHDAGRVLAVLRDAATGRVYIGGYFE